MPSFINISQILILSNNPSAQCRNKNQQGREKENHEIGKFIVTYMLIILGFLHENLEGSQGHYINKNKFLEFFIQIDFIFTQLAFLNLLWS